MPKHLMTKDAWLDETQGTVALGEICWKGRKCTCKRCSGIRTGHRQKEIISIGEKGGSMGSPQVETGCQDALSCPIHQMPSRKKVAFLDPSPLSPQELAPYGISPVSDYFYPVCSMQILVIACGIWTPTPNFSPAERARDHPQP